MQLITRADGKVGLEVFLLNTTKNKLSLNYNIIERGRPIEIESGEIVSCDAGVADILVEQTKTFDIQKNESNPSFGIMTNIQHGLAVFMTYEEALAAKEQVFPPIEITDVPEGTVEKPVRKPAPRKPAPKKVKTLEEMTVEELILVAKEKHNADFVVGEATKEDVLAFLKANSK